VGITNTLKNYVIVERSVIMRNAEAQPIAAEYFNFCISLYVLLGFCEDFAYKRVVINARHKLILI